MVMLALIPYLALSAALEPLSPIIADQLHMSAQTMSLGSGLSNAAYAAGTVLAVQFAQHLPQRRMMVGYALVLVTGSVLTAAAPNGGTYIAGHVLQGLATSMLLIAAVPPLAIGYPRDKLRLTAVIMNMCIFGAVALGPVHRRGPGRGQWMATAVLGRCRGVSPRAGVGTVDVRGRPAGQPRLAA